MTRGVCSDKIKLYKETKEGLALMPISAKTVLKQLSLIKPILSVRSLKMIRRGQDKIGELMEMRYKEHVVTHEHKFENFTGAWMIPYDERRQGVILYLHGGGYTCGGIDYAKGFGSMLAARTGTKVFCAAYRLAPEHPFPCALEDSLEAYSYLLSKGYSPDKITLCGESAGGGLCYALSLKLRERKEPLPCGIIAISPWTDLTGSGDSNKSNAETDPTLTRELLEFYAENYTADRLNPYVSPFFAELGGMPPSLIYAAENEILFSDAVELYKKLTKAGISARFITKKDRPHAYLLYGLKEDNKDFAELDRFLNRVMSAEKKLRWLRLDNAAKIYPATRRRGWSNVFRLSMTLSEEIDKEVLRTALDVTVRRFPSIAVRLRKGIFWYYLQELSSPPEIREDLSYPLAWMTKKETRRCALRVLTHKNRIAIEVFHSLTDGNGALVFLKSLVAEYLQLKKGLHLPAEKGVLGRLQEPDEAEFEDSFQKYAGAVCADRKENTAWQITGTPETAGFLNVTCFSLPVDKVIEKAHEYGASVTAFLCAVMMQALQNLQKEKVPNIKRRKPIKILIPVNLRKIFGSKTLRNFAMYTTPELLTRLGEYSFEEILSVIKHKMGAEITAKQMSMKIATNVKSERIMAVRVMPLFIKNIVMKAIFDAVGERKSCFSMSNLGAVDIPEDMKQYVERFDFILGVQAQSPYNCGVISYKNELNVSFIRNIKEPHVERHFYNVLRELGIPAKVQSNGGDR